MLIVCFDIHFNIEGRKNPNARWKLGACSSSRNDNYDGPKYQYNAFYTERCCLPSGRYTLICYNTPPARGWNDIYIVFNGHRYCDDFISYTSFQKIEITGDDFESFK